MSETKDTLLTSAYIVRDETNTGSNTASRVGQLFVDIINALGAIEDDMGNFVLSEDLAERIQKLGLSDYLKKDDAANTYLTINNALITYLQKSVFDDLFEKVNVAGEGETEHWTIKAKYDLWSVGGISSYQYGTGDDTPAGTNVEWSQLYTDSVNGQKIAEITIDGGDAISVYAPKGGAGSFASLSESGNTKETASAIWGRTINEVDNTPLYGWVDSSKFGKSYNGSTYISTDNDTITFKASDFKATLNKSDFGLGNVENIALTTWTGSTNITTLGTITTGVWHGSKIDSQYFDEADPLWTAWLEGDKGKQLLRILDKIDVVDGNVKVSTNLYSTDGISAYGYGASDANYASYFSDLLDAEIQGISDSDKGKVWGVTSNGTWGLIQNHDYSDLNLMYLGINGKAVDSDKLDGIDSTNFMISKSGVINDSTTLDALTGFVSREYSGSTGSGLEAISMYGSVVSIPNNRSISNAPSTANNYNWYWQLAFSTNGKMFSRYQTNGGGWSTWRTIIDSSGTASDSYRFNGYESKVFLKFGDDGNKLNVSWEDTTYRNRAIDQYIEWYNGGWNNFAIGRLAVGGSNGIKDTSYKFTVNGNTNLIGDVYVNNQWVIENGTNSLNIGYGSRAKALNLYSDTFVDVRSSDAAWLVFDGANKKICICDSGIVSGTTISGTQGTTYGAIEWDSTNHAFKFHGNIYATGGISTFAFGDSGTLANLSVSNQLTAGKVSSTLINMGNTPIEAKMYTYNGTTYNGIFLGDASKTILVGYAASSSNLGNNKDVRFACSSARFDWSRIKELIVGSNNSSSTDNIKSISLSAPSGKTISSTERTLYIQIASTYYALTLKQMS